jgi:Two component regulator propeller
MQGNAILKTLSSFIQHENWRIFLCQIILCQLCLGWIAGNSVAEPILPKPDFPFTQLNLEKVGDSDSVGDIITSLAQDTRGLIWIGTQNGLIMYDGYRFRHFDHNPADPNSLGADSVSSLWAAKDGRIWVGTDTGGLSIFDPSSERFKMARKFGCWQHHSVKRR